MSCRREEREGGNQINKLRKRDKRTNRERKSKQNKSIAGEEEVIVCDILKTIPVHYSKFLVRQISLQKHIRS